MKTQAGVDEGISLEVIMTGEVDVSVDEVGRKNRRTGAVDTGSTLLKLLPDS